MNILFFLIPKHKVEYIFNDYSVRQVLEKLDVHGYSAIPMLDKEGHYIDAISEGDILMYIKHHKELSLFNLEDVSIKEVIIRRKVQSITINSNIEDLLELSLNQNFIPVVDDLNRFIGIITRRDIIKHFYIKNGF